MDIIQLVLVLLSGSFTVSITLIPLIFTKLLQIEKKLAKIETVIHMLHPRVQFNGGNVTNKK